MMAYSIVWREKVNRQNNGRRLLVKYLVDKGKVPVLAVDADANANLNEVLVWRWKKLLGCPRRDEKRRCRRNDQRHFYGNETGAGPGGGKGYDLVVMGRPEGPGCYCAATRF